jgi:hypothetical protein
MAKDSEQNLENMIPSCRCRVGEGGCTAYGQCKFKDPTNCYDFHLSLVRQESNRHYQQNLSGLQK